MKFLNNYFHKDNILLVFSSIYFFILFIFSKEIIVINEEFIIGLSFLILFYLIQKFISNLISLELDSVTLQLFEQFNSIYVFKLTLQKKLLRLYNKKVKLYKFIKLVTCKIEDYLYFISLRRTLITKEAFSLYTNNLIITHLIKSNVKLRVIYNNILESTKYNLN